MSEDRLNSALAKFELSLRDFIEKKLDAKADLYIVLELRSELIDLNRRLAQWERKMEDALRDMKENQKLKEERAEAAREALATETERRRDELAVAAETDDRRFSRREKALGWATTVVLAAIGFYISTHGFHRPG